MFVLTLGALGMLVILGNPGSNVGNSLGNSPTVGTGCIYQYSRLQLDVFNDLSWLNGPILTKFSCEYQKNVLDILAHFPHDERNEEFDRLIDEVTRKQSG